MSQGQKPVILPRATVFSYCQGPKPAILPRATVIPCCREHILVFLLPVAEKTVYREQNGLFSLPVNAISYAGGGK